MKQLLHISQARKVRIFVPRSARKYLKGIVSKLCPSLFKHGEELEYWNKQWETGGFSNTYYEKILLQLAGENDGSFLKGKVVADFGCGPQGSLCWASQARARIGIDVLAEQYVRSRLSG